MKEYFERNYVWSIETKIEIGSKIGLSLCQIKKWNFDERKRRGLPTTVTKIKK